MARTVSYSGSWDASRVISARKVASVVLPAKSCWRRDSVLFYAKIVALAFVSLLVRLCECLFAGAADAVTMPKGHGKVNPFLVTVCTLRAGEKLIYTRSILSVREMLRTREAADGLLSGRVSIIGADCESIKKSARY